MVVGRPTTPPRFGAAAIGAQQLLASAIVTSGRDPVGSAASAL
jgi:hypothetical protein